MSGTILGDRADMAAHLRWIAGDVREQTENVDDPFILGNIHGACDALRDAADEIERLRSLIVRLGGQPSRLLGPTVF